MSSTWAETWVQWSRDNIRLRADAPLTSNARELQAPWAKEAWLFKYHENGEGPGLRNTLAACQTPDPTYFAARFTAVNLYQSLLTDDGYPLTEDDAIEARKRVREDLRFIADFLKVEDCPRNWPAIKFELLISLALKDWTRARDLYEVAKRYQVRQPGCMARRVTHCSLLCIPGAASAPGAGE